MQTNNLQDNHKNKTMKNTKPEKKTETSLDDKPLKDMVIQVNEFGQIVKDVALDKINSFLNENVPDKKLEESDDTIVA